MGLPQFEQIRTPGWAGDPQWTQVISTGVTAANFLPQNWQNWAPALFPLPQAGQSKDIGSTGVPQMWQNWAVSRRLA